MLLGLIPPDGTGANKICAGAPHGDEIFSRLQRVYSECAEADDEMPSRCNQRAVVPESVDKIESLLLAHAAGLLAIARAAESDDGMACTGDPPRLIRVDERDEIEASEDDGFLKVEMFDAFEDKFGPDSAARQANELILLYEPLYQWAEDEYAIANYVLWPIFRGDSGA